MTPKKFYKIILYLTIITLIAVILITYFTWSSLNKASRNVYEKEVYYDNFTTKVYALESLNRSFNKIRGDIDNIEFALPKEKKLDRLMTDLESSAIKNNIQFNVYKYVDPNSRGKKKVEEVKNLDLSQTVKEDGYYRMPFEISLEGKYPNVLSFLKQMEQSKRLISVKSIELVKIDLGDGSPTDAVKLVANINVFMKRN